MAYPKIEQDLPLKIMTFNCWGIPFIAKNRADRIFAIGEHLNNTDFDVICLQEVWEIDDFKKIKSRIEDKLPYTHYFFSGPFGSGICIFSKFQIQDVMFYKWSLNGYCHKIFHGDWFGGKGLGLCRIKINNVNINIYIAHLHANYDLDNDEYHAHRIIQAFDAAQFVRMTERGADAVILAGDLNTCPNDLTYDIICGVAGLTNACSKPFSCFGTSENALNSYTPCSVARKYPLGLQIDHILYLGSKNYKIVVDNFKSPLPNRVPGKKFSYSDHEAVAADLRIVKGEFQVVDVDVRESLQKAMDICAESLKCVKRQQIWYLISCLVLIVPLIVSMGVDTMVCTMGPGIALDFARILATAIFCYALFMGTIWNCAERNVLKAAYLGMGVHLAQLNNNIGDKDKDKESK